MQPEIEAQSSTEVVPLNVIRVETALSRYPVHRLAKQGSVSIEIKERSADGASIVQWQVTHNSEYGQPGPLAYKIDTLIVNRRIEEASRPIPEMIKLGSIHEISRELGVSGGRSREHIKQSLYQNAFASIRAKFKYKLSDGTTKELQAGFNRYSVIFTGEELPDGRRADAVYLLLNKVFLQVISGAQTRPLDYDYLKDLPPASQRLYEHLSYQIYAALKGGRKHAKLCYSEFCTYAPLTRFLNWNQVRPQMSRIHREHLASGYIESVEFELGVDQNGKPDWTMMYTPGPRAKAEFRAFAKRGGPRTLEIEPMSSPVLALPFPEQSEPGPLAQELISRGVTPGTANNLVASEDHGLIAEKIEHFDFLKKHQSRSISQSDGGYLADSIRKAYGPPDKFVSQADEARRLEEKANRLRQEAEDRARKQRERDRERSERGAIDAYWESLTAEEQATLEIEAGISGAVIAPDDYVARLKRAALRNKLIRARLGLPPESDPDE